MTVFPLILWKKWIVLTSEARRDLSLITICRLEVSSTIAVTQSTSTYYSIIFGNGGFIPASNAVETSSVIRNLIADPGFGCNQRRTTEHLSEQVQTRTNSNPKHLFEISTGTNPWLSIFLFLRLRVDVLMEEGGAGAGVPVT